MIAAACRPFYGLRAAQNPAYRLARLFSTTYRQSHGCLTDLSNGIRSLRTLNCPFSQSLICPQWHFGANQWQVPNWQFFLEPERHVAKVRRRNRVCSATSSQRHSRATEDFRQTTLLYRKSRHSKTALSVSLRISSVLTQLIHHPTPSSQPSKRHSVL